MPQNSLTPDTAAYLFLGLGVAFGVLGVYIFSLFARARSARHDLETLKNLSDE